jgi:hypothetical protein
MTSDRVVEGAVLDRWAAVAIGDRTHLIGVLRGGHSRLAPGRWIITSPVRAYDQPNQIVVTASTGRTYHLLEPLDGPIPPEVIDLLERAARVWQLPPNIPIALTDL